MSLESCCGLDANPLYNLRGAGRGTLVRHDVGTDYNVRTSVPLLLCRKKADLKEATLSFGNDMLITQTAQILFSLFLSRVGLTVITGR